MEQNNTLLHQIDALLSAKLAVFEKRLENKFEILGEQIGNVETKVGSLTETVKDLETKVGCLTKTVGNLETKVKNLGKAIHKVQCQLGEIVEDIVRDNRIQNSSA